MRSSSRTHLWPINQAPKGLGWRREGVECYFMARRVGSGRLRSVSSGRSNLPRNHFIRLSTVLNSLGHTAYLTLFVTGTLQDTLRHLDTLASFDTKGHTSSAGHTGKHWRLKLCKAGPRLRPAHFIFEQNCQRLVKKIEHAARNWLRKKEIQHAEQDILYMPFHHTSGSVSLHN